MLVAPARLKEKGNDLWQPRAAALTWKGGCRSHLEGGLPHTPAARGCGTHLQREAAAVTWRGGCHLSGNLVVVRVDTPWVKKKNAHIFASGVSHVHGCPIMPIVVVIVLAVKTCCNKRCYARISLMLVAKQFYCCCC